MLRSCVARALARAGTALRLFDRRLAIVETLLGEPLTDIEAHAIARACRASRSRFGAYYAWRLRRVAIASTFADLDRHRARGLISRHDASCYGVLDAALEDPDGLVVAIPHHGPFVPAIVAMCGHLRARREVIVLHGSPRERSERGAFDAMRRNLYEGLGDHARVVFVDDSGHGRAHVIRDLRRGAVVFALPDAYRAIDATYQVPFCGAQRNVMLGTAALARRADVRVLPVVAVPRRGIFGFASLFGAALRPMPCDGSREGALHADYRLTVAIFRAFEPLMSGTLLAWEYCTHHAADGEFVAGLTPEETVDVVGPLLLDDPRIRLRADTPIVLDRALPS